MKETSKLSAEQKAELDKAFNETIKKRGISLGFAEHFLLNEYFQAGYLACLENMTKNQD